MKLPATIYARFSNQEQAQGSSKARQLKLCRELIADRGWQLSEDRILIDEGLSAFSGANRAPGGLLHEFEKQAEAGLYRSGHVLVVEHIDRISRQGHDEVLPFVKKMTEAGVTVAVASGGRVYHAYERVTLGAVIEAVVAAELAREESEKKSNRLKGAQYERIKAAQESAAAGQHISETRTVPGWINVERISKLSDPPKYRMTLNEERAAILREIFQMTIDGYGTPAIAKILNGRGEPVWNHLDRKSKHGWTVGYLTKLVLNRAVMGEYHPLSRPRGAKESSKGITILNHYPQAIDAVTFARAQTERKARKASSGSWQKSHNNLFSGIATCAECGGRLKQEMTVRKGAMRNSRSGRYPARKSISYLKCHNALNKVWDEDKGQLRCTNPTAVRYETLEPSILDVAMKFVVVRKDVASESQQAQLHIEIAERQRFIEDKQKQVDTLVDSFSRTGSPAVERRMLELERELLDDQSALRELQLGLADEPTAETIEEYKARLATLLASIDSDNEQERADARIRVKQQLRHLLTKMECDREGFTHVVLGQDALYAKFDPAGQHLGGQPLAGAVYQGPDGEPDWHPDEIAA